MDNIVNEYYIIDNIIFKSNNCNYLFNSTEYQFYEVIRTTRGKYLFLEDHLDRLQESLKCLNFFQKYFNSEAIKCLNNLLINNSKQDGNVKLLCKVLKKRLIYAAYYIPHYYPPEILYQSGVKLKSYIIERNQPNFKQVNVNEFIKKEINVLLKSGEFFEVLLVNKEGIITEGSKSNFFLIKENTLFSAPDSLILKGITRKYILKIAHELGMKYLTKNIILNDLTHYDAAFISGTSPKVLPVNKIDTIDFNPENRLLNQIISKYNEIINHYIEKHIYQN